MGDKATALDVARKLNAKLVLGEFDLPHESGGVPTFAEYAAIWLHGYIKGLRRPSTFERYAGLLEKYVNPALGKMPMDQVKRKDIRDLLLTIHGKGASRSTICLLRDVMSGVMGYAVDEELIPLNPVTGITKRLGLDRDKHCQVQVLSTEEISHLLETCAKHEPEYYPLFLCACRTGMRLGEILALHWGDIDWFGNFIEVKRSFRNGKIDATKTGKTRRVDMSDQLKKALQKLHSLRKEEALRHHKGQVVETVFHRVGQPIAQNSIRNVFKRILGKAGLRNMRFHDIRHTFASLLLSSGQSPVYVKEQMGHSSIQVTVDIYGHWIPSGNRDAVNALDLDGTPAGTLCAPVTKTKGATP